MTDRDLRTVSEDARRWKEYNDAAINLEAQHQSAVPVNVESARQYALRERWLAERKLQSDKRAAMVDQHMAARGLDPTETLGVAQGAVL